MNATKRWSYRQITEHTEQQIRVSMRLAGKATDDEARRIHCYFAVGAYHAWHSLTSGWQDSIDDERLATLCGSTWHRAP